jgi:RimJ/RimL family protein N-acetyltransferase
VRALLTPRLALRAAQPQDAAAVAWVFDQVVHEAHGWTGGLRPTVGDRLRAARSSTDDLVVCDRTTGEVLGTFTLVRRGGCTRIGVSFGPRGRGRGLAREALTALVPWMQQVGFPAPVIETAVSNVAMRRTAEAVGFVVGREYVHRLPNGSRVPAVRYVLGPRPT